MKLSNTLCRRRPETFASLLLIACQPFAAVLGLRGESTRLAADSFAAGAASNPKHTQSCALVDSSDHYLRLANRRGRNEFKRHGLPRPGAGTQRARIADNLCVPVTVLWTDIRLELAGFRVRPVMTSS